MASSLSIAICSPSLSVPSLSTSLLFQEQDFLPHCNPHPSAPTPLKPAPLSPSPDIRPTPSPPLRSYPSASLPKIFFSLACPRAPSPSPPPLPPFLSPLNQRKDTYRQDHTSACSADDAFVDGGTSCRTPLRPWREGGRLRCGILLFGWGALVFGGGYVDEGGRKRKGGGTFFGH